MEGHPRRPPDPAPPDDDPGEPLEPLAGLREETTAGFLARLRTTIHRRVLVVDLAELSWRGVSQVVLEYARIVVQIFHRPSSREDEPR